MSDTSQSELKSPPHTNGMIAPDGFDEEDRQKMRPADIDADVKEMERRKRVDMIMSSKLFREELERIIETQLKDGTGSASGLMQQISDMMGVPRNAGNAFKSSNCVVPINDIRGIEAMGYAKGEKILRCKLAAVYRLVDLYGWSQGTSTLITARLNQDEEHFLVNPYGMLFHEITASSLIKVDMQGQVVEQGTTNFSVNIASFSLHAAIHSSRPDIKCIIHVRTPSVVAISALKCGILPISEQAVVIGDTSTHLHLGGILSTEEIEKIARNLGPNNKVLILTNQGIVCCGETIEEAFFNARNTVLACEQQLKLMPVGIDNLVLITDEQRKKLYDAAHKAPESTPRPDQPSVLEGKVERKWRVGGIEFEALMRMLDNAGFRTGYIYRHPLVKGEPPKPRNDVEVPPAVSSLGYLLEEEELYRQGLWKKLEGGKKGSDRSRWLNSPNVYQKVEILETGTPDPKKITKWVADGSPTHSSTPVKIEHALQFVPKNTNPKEFKLLQQQIKDYRRADKISAGPQSHILEGVTWEEAKKMQDASVTQTGDQVVLMGAASKGIIQRGFQHNATMYKSPYAKNPFDCVTDEELDEYKRVVERKARGEFDDTTDYSESEGLSSAQINKRISDIRSPTSVASETEEESRDEPQVLRIETTQAPKPSQPEVVMSDGILGENLPKASYRTSDYFGHPKGSYMVPNPKHFHIVNYGVVNEVCKPKLVRIPSGKFGNYQREWGEKPLVTINIGGTKTLSLDIPMKTLRDFIEPFASALNLKNLPTFEDVSSQTSYRVTERSNLRLVELSSSESDGSDFELDIVRKMHEEILLDDINSNEPQDFDYTEKIVEDFEDVNKEFDKIMEVAREKEAEEENAFEIDEDKALEKELSDFESHYPVVDDVDLLIVGIEDADNSSSSLETVIEVKSETQEDVEIEAEVDKSMDDWMGSEEVDCHEEEYLSAPLETVDEIEPKKDAAHQQVGKSLFILLDSEVESQNDKVINRQEGIKRFSNSLETVDKIENKKNNDMDHQEEAKDSSVLLETIRETEKVTVADNQNKKEDIGHPSNSLETVEPQNDEVANREREENILSCSLETVTDHQEEAKDSPVLLETIRKTEKVTVADNQNKKEDTDHPSNSLKPVEPQNDEVANREREENILSSSLETVTDRREDAKDSSALLETIRETEKVTVADNQNKKEDIDHPSNLLKTVESQNDEVANREREENILSSSLETVTAHREDAKDSPVLLETIRETEKVTVADNQDKKEDIDHPSNSLKTVQPQNDEVANRERKENILSSSLETVTDYQEEAKDPSILLETIKKVLDYRNKKDVGLPFNSLRTVDELEPQNNDVTNCQEKRKDFFSSLETVDKIEQKKYKEKLTDRSILLKASSEIEFKKASVQLFSSLKILEELRNKLTNCQKEEKYFSMSFENIVGHQVELEKERIMNYQNKNVVGHPSNSLETVDELENHQKKESSFFILVEIIEGIKYLYDKLVGYVEDPKNFCICADILNGIDLLITKIVEYQDKNKREPQNDKVTKFEKKKIDFSTLLRIISKVVILVDGPRIDPEGAVCKNEPQNDEVMIELNHIIGELWSYMEELADSSIVLETLCEIDLEEGKLVDHHYVREYLIEKRKVTDYQEEQKNEEEEADASLIVCPSSVRSLTHSLLDTIIYRLNKSWNKKDYKPNMYDSTDPLKHQIGHESLNKEELFKKLQLSSGKPDHMQVKSVYEYIDKLIEKQLKLCLGDCNDDSKGESQLEKFQQIPSGSGVEIDKYQLPQPETKMDLPFNPRKGCRLCDEQVCSSESSKMVVVETIQGKTFSQSILKNNQTAVIRQKGNKKSLLEIVVNDEKVDILDSKGRNINQKKSDRKDKKRTDSKGAKAVGMQTTEKLRVDVACGTSNVAQKTEKVGVDVACSTESLPQLVDFSRQKEEARKTENVACSTLSPPQLIRSKNKQISTCMKREKRIKKARPFRVITDTKQRENIEEPEAKEKDSSPEKTTNMETPLDAEQKEEVRPKQLEVKEKDSKISTDTKQDENLQADKVQVATSCPIASSTKSLEVDKNINVHVEKGRKRNLMEIPNIEATPNKHKHEATQPDKVPKRDKKREAVTEEKKFEKMIKDKHKKLTRQSKRMLHCAPKIEAPPKKQSLKPEEYFNKLCDLFETAKSFSILSKSSNITVTSDALKDLQEILSDNPSGEITNREGKIVTQEDMKTLKDMVESMIGQLTIIQKTLKSCKHKQKLKKGEMCMKGPCRFIPRIDKCIDSTKLSCILGTMSVNQQEKDNKKYIEKVMFSDPGSNKDVEYEKETSTLFNNKYLKKDTLIDFIISVVTTYRIPLYCNECYNCETPLNYISIVLNARQRIICKTCKRWVEKGQVLILEVRACIKNMFQAVTDDVIEAFSKVLITPPSSINQLDFDVNIQPMVYAAYTKLEILCLNIEHFEEEAEHDVNFEKMLAQLKYFYNKYFNDLSSDEIKYLKDQLIVRVFQKFDSILIGDKLKRIETFLNNIFDNFFMEIESPKHNDEAANVTSFEAKKSISGNECFWVTLSQSADDSPKHNIPVLDVDNIPLKPPSDSMIYNDEAGEQLFNTRRSLSPIAEENVLTTHVESHDFTDYMAGGDHVQLEKPDGNVIVSNETKFFRSNSARPSAYVQSSSVTFVVNKDDKEQCETSDEGNWMGYLKAKF